MINPTKNLKVQSIFHLKSYTACHEIIKCEFKKEFTKLWWWTKEPPLFFCFKKATVKSGALLAYYFNLQSQHAMQSRSSEISAGRRPRTTDTQWRHKSKKSEILGGCGRQNMLWPYLKIWEWELILGRAVKAISSPGVRSPCLKH